MRKLVFSTLIAGILIGSGSLTYAQAIPTVGLTTGKFSWNWTPANGDTTTTFRVKCGATAGVYTLSKDTGNVTAKTYPVNSIITSAGTYFCAVSAFDAGTGLESSNSNEVSFRAANVPTSPTNLVVLGQ